MQNDPKRQYFSDLGSRWDFLPKMADSSQRIRAYVEKSSHPVPDRILDLGCGTGILLPYLFERHPDARLVVEMDYAEGMLIENARKFPDSRVLHLRVDITLTPFVVPTFDLILCFCALPHFGDPAPVLGELVRALRPGGVITIGHLADSRAVNEFHGGLDAPVKNDRLPPAHELATLLRAAGATALIAEEEKDWFFVRGEKAKQ